MEFFCKLFLKENKYTKDIIFEDFYNNFNDEFNNKHESIIHIYNYINYLISNEKINSENIYNSRIKYFHDFVLINNNLNENNKEYLFESFSKTQKIYNKLNRFVFLYKKYKAKKYDVNCDICLNDFNKLNKNILFELFCKNDKTIYKYRISDIITIINNALTYNYNFISSPQEIKNPYTNIAFTISELFYIYFVIKNSSYLMPFLFHQLFITNFNYYQFKLNNECYIREEAINNFIKSDDIGEKKKYILSMFSDYSEYAPIIIDFLFPAMILVKHFNSSYLKIYLQSLFSLNPDIKFDSSMKLIEKLVKFHKLNPYYGQPYITKKRDASNNIHLIFRFNTYINENENFIDNENIILQLNNFENNTQSQVEQEESQQEEQEEEEQDELEEQEEQDEQEEQEEQQEQEEILEHYYEYDNSDEN